MENSSVTKLSKLKNKKGQKDKKCELVIPLQFHHEPSVKILPKMVEKPAVQNESHDSDFPALPGNPENSPSIRININSSTSFSTVLTQTPQVQYSNVNVQHVNKACSKNSSHTEQRNLPIKTLGDSKVEVTKVNPGNTKQKKVPNSNQTSESAPTSSTKKNSTANQATKSEKKTKKKNKKGSKTPQGKVNTLSQEQYRSFTEPNDIKSPERNFLSNLEDLGEYPALGLSPLKESNVRVKKEQNFNKKENINDVSENEKQDVVLPGPRLQSQEGNLLAKPSKSPLKSPLKQEKSPANKKFNSPIQMNLVDMLSKMKLKPNKNILKIPALNVKRDKIKGHGILNSLDASGPTRKRGKEREVPKKPKLSKIKKVILKERVEKRLRLALLSMTKMKEQGTVTEITSESNNNKIESLASELPKLDLSNEDNEESLASEIQKLDLSNEDNEESLPTTVKEEVEPEDDAQATIVETEEEKEQKLRIKCAKKLLHCRKFREYCNHFISEEIDTLTNNLMAELVRYQDRLFMKDPVKARARKRFVCGLKEVTKNLKLRKLKLVIIAPDIEEINSEGGLNDALHCILSFCENYVTPLLFSLPRRKLGKVCKKKVPLSCVGIFNYEGTEDIYKELMELVEEARQVYKQTLALAEQNLTDEMIKILCDDQVDHVKVEEMRVLFWQSQSNH